MVSRYLEILVNLWSLETEPGNPLPLGASDSVMGPYLRCLDTYDKLSSHQLIITMKTEEVKYQVFWLIVLDDY